MQWTLSGMFWPPLVVGLLLTVPGMLWLIGSLASWLLPAALVLGLLVLLQLPGLLLLRAWLPPSEQASDKEQAAAERES